jgi:hypothetical protein
MAFGGLLPCVVFVLPHRAGDELGLPLSLALALISFVGLGVSVYFFCYRVIVKDESITIGAFRKRVIPCESIIDWDVLKGNRSSELIVYLRGGERLRLSGLIGDFDELVGMINSHEAIPPRGHPDSAEKLKDWDARARANRHANWIAISGLIVVGITVIALWKAGLLN